MIRRKRGKLHPNQGRVSKSRRHAIMRRLIIILIIIIFSIGLEQRSNRAQQREEADVAAYQLGVIAEAKPGEAITYDITLTNFGPATVHSFYLLDGWSVNQQGIAGFAQPI